MGVNGIWKFLEKYKTRRPNTWRSLQGKVLAVDLSFWIVQSETAVSHVIASNPDFKPHLRTIFSKLARLVKKGAKPLVVLDGIPPALKEKTIAKRRNLTNWSGKISKRKSQKAQESKELLEIAGIPYIDLAKGEAEAFCAKLNQCGIADATVTPDADALLFGSSHLILDVGNEKQSFFPELTMDALRKAGHTQNDLIAYALFLGSDYCDGVPGVGMKRVLQLKDACEGELLDWLQQWVSNGDESEFTKTFNGNKLLSKYLANLKEAYTAEDLNIIVQAYQNPYFLDRDLDMITNRDWLQWRAPDVDRLFDFLKDECSVLRKTAARQAVQFALDHQLNTSVTGTFELGKILRQSTRNCEPVYHCEYTCLDAGVINVVQALEENKGLTITGTHLKDYFSEKRPELVDVFDARCVSQKVGQKNWTVEPVAQDAQINKTVLHEELLEEMDDVQTSCQQTEYSITSALSKLQSSATTVGPTAIHDPANSDISLSSEQTLVSRFHFPLFDGCDSTEFMQTSLVLQSELKRKKTESEMFDCVAGGKSNVFKNKSPPEQITVVERSISNISPKSAINLESVPNFSVSPISIGVDDEKTKSVKDFKIKAVLHTPDVNKVSIDSSNHLCLQKRILATPLSDDAKILQPRTNKRTKVTHKTPLGVRDHSQRAMPENMMGEELNKFSTKIVEPALVINDSEKLDEKKSNSPQANIISKHSTMEIMLVPKSVEMLDSDIWVCCGCKNELPIKKTSCPNCVSLSRAVFDPCPSTMDVFSVEDRFWICWKCKKKHFLSEKLSCCKFRYR